MSVISKKSFLNKADKQQRNWEQTTGQEAGGVLNKQDFIRQAQSAAQQRRQAQEQKAPQSERSGFDRTATPASIAGLGAPAPTSQRQKERYNQEIGQYGAGNIDLYNRPQYRNADGSISTVDSTSFNIQGKEVLLPSVWMKDGKAYRSSDGDEILQHFYDTGEFLGVFDTVDAANSYAEKLHDAQDYYYTTQREKALDEAVAHDQLQGMKRTLAILESQKKQEQAQQPSILSMLGKASDPTLPTFQAESAQSETDRRIQELQDEIDRQENESQMQGTKRPETYTAKNVGRYKDRLIALASVPGIWTKRQKQEAEEIIGTQSGFGGLLGYEQNVTAFAPYQEAMRKGDTEAAKQWQQIYDVLYTRLYSKQTAVASGLQEGLGVTSAAAAVGKALGANEDEYHRQMKNAQRAQEEHPVLAGGAKIAGSLALMSGIGEAAGAGLAAAGMNTGSLGFKVAAGALSFAGADAVYNAGAAAMGDMSTEDYLKRIAISGAQGMAGNLAGGLVGTGLANVLRDTHKMTPFMEFLRQTASGVTNASVNQAVGYLAADEKPTKEEIATNLVTAFAFSVLSSAISSYQTTQQQKAQMNQAYQAIKQGYRAMTAGTENMTPEAKAQRAQFIMQQTQSLRESVNSYYVAGQQKAVDNLNETLDLIDEAMRAYVNWYAAASSAMQTPNVMLPGGGSTGQLPTAADLPTTPTDPQMQKQVEQELQTAIQQGLQQAQAGTQNTQPPESGQALQNGNAAAAAAQIAVQAAEQNQQAQQPSLPTAQAAAVQPQQLEQSTQQEAGLPTPQQVQTEQTATPLERLEAMGVSGKRAQSMARGIEAFYRGQITDGEVLGKLLSFPEVQNVMRQMTDADIEAVVSGNVQAQNQQPVNTAAQQVPGSQQPGVQNEATTHEGGMNNGTEQLPAGQKPGTEQQSEQLPDGDGGRILSESTGGQSGILAEGRPQRAFNQGRTAVERENLGRTLRLEKVSSQSLGLPNGTEEREIQVMPESHWDTQMQQTAQRISYETGKPVTYVLGSIRIRQADGSVSAARGVYTENGIIVKADHRYLNIDQIADHEAFHDYAANNPGLVRQIERAIVEQYSREEFDAVVEKYLKNLRGVYDLPEHASGQEVAEVYGIVKEEICADAYAGINLFGAHAEKYRSEAQAVLQERKVTTPGSETAAATQRRTGPPERYSYGGVNANTADQIDGRVYDLLANVRKKPDGEFVYSIQLNENEKKAPAPPRQYQNGTAKAENRPVRVPTDASEASVAEKRLPVKARFSMDEPVEQTQDLMAIHNLDGKKMDSMLQLGAIPSPSVAIVKASQGHTQYGDYTLVFPRQSIDPQEDRRNKVYGADAWTPTAANAIVEREVNYEARRAAEQKIAQLANQVAGGIFSRDSAIGSRVDEVATMDEAELAKQLAKDDTVRAAYLAEQGKDIEPVLKEKVWDSFGNQALQDYTEKIGAQELAQLYVKLETGDRLTETELETARESIMDAWIADHEYVLNHRPELRETRVARQRDKISDARVEDFIRNAEALYEDGGQTRDGVDRYATQDKLREAVDDADVEAWVRGQLRGVLGEPGIYNGKERFTTSGRRRSFRETHGAYTAENIVKAMNQASARGESYWGVGAKGILSVATPRYKSVDAIHADEGRLQNMPEEEYNRLLQELDKRIEGIVADVQKTSGSYDMDEIAGLLMENAGQDAMRIQQAFSRQGYDIDGGLATEIAGMYRQAAEMPTGYFEAKPQRVVTFDEPVCIAPDDCPPERLEKMKAAGLNVIEYEAGNDEQRMEIARSLKGMRFSVDEPQAETGSEIEQALESKPAEPEQKEKKPRKKNETKPVAESLPIIAKRNLRQDMQGIFSIPEGRRAEINQIIDTLADRMLKNGELTQEDRDAFFDRMYAEGVMEVAADEYLQQARSEIAGRRIYVPESVKHEFGDDWGYFRKKAFAAGVMLVNDTSAAGIDMVNAELADTLPGMFHADDLDSREILENIVQTAEEGKSQNMSLAQYTALLAGQEYVSEDEVLDNIERQMDEALRTFTRTAKLEVHLRDRTGVKIAQEREKSAAARQREALSRAKERQQRKEMSQRQREYRELKEQQKKTLKALQWLAKNQYRAPEELQGTWDEVLGDLDIYAVSAANEMRYSKKHDATWKDLAEMYKDAQANDPNFLPSKELEKIVHRLDNKKIADMDLNALQDLYKAAVGLRTEFYNRNNVINDDMNRLFAEVYTDSKKELDFGAQTKAGEAARQGKKLDSLFNQEQLSPMNVMQRMAGWNPNSAWYSMAKQLEKGERDIRDYTVSATKQLREFLTEHEDWAKKADGQGDDGIWYEVKIPQLVGALEVGKPPKFGDTITVWMTPTQKVHMYLESKSTENLRHMEGGRTFADKTLYSQGKRREAFAQGKTVRMAPETVKAIVGSLTPEEQELAQALEQYYNVFAKKEINRVSNILYGYDKAVSKNYTPIYTNSNYTKSELGVYDATAEGVGNLKSRQFSKNPSYNIGAFDAFERHVEQTARFVGMAIPARNWQTLLNWRERENSMADIITHDWGDESLKYIQDLVQTLQGGAASTRDSVSMGAEKVFSNYIGAVFGANPSIVFKQLGSIPLAGAWLDFKNFPSPGQVKRIDRSLIEKYTQELDWRTLGYSTPETKQLKENPNWTQTNKFTNFIFGGGAITAMDGWAASVLWPWAENKVRAEFPELETGSQEQIDSGSSPFYQKVAEVFNEAVARSQSTSDEMHQGTLRKSKNPVTRAFTMFKSDSSQTYNALRQRAGEAEYYKRIGDTENYNKAKRGLGVAFLAAVGGYIWAQGIEFLMNLWKRKGKAYRDEDGNLTAGSVAKEMALGLVGDLAGIVTYGEELADVIGNIITGDKWYGIDTPGLEQLSDVVETIVEQGQNGLDVLKDAADVVKNGGSLGEYLHRYSGDIVGGIKDLAAAAATYLPGISVNNLEAYLLGTVRWASPELAAAYDDALATANKNQMKGLRGAELERKISDTLHNRRVETDETTNETLASLYESGFTKAVPSDTPGSISVDGEDRKLSAYQKQVYDKTWSGAVGSRLQELIASDVFQAADDETQEKMLSGLYEYAGEKAKAAVFDDYEVKTSTQKADDVLATGAEMADYLELKLAGAVDKYLDAIDGGLDAQSAKDVALGMAELAPEEGKKTVSDVQKWRAAIDAVDGTSAQRDALLAVMKDSTKQKYEIADSYGIEARTWVQLKEILPQFDEDGNGSYKGEEIENAIDALNGHSGIMLPGGDGPQQLTNEMRAVLWQLFTGSKSAKNNPYSERVGSQVIAEREKAKRED